MFLLADISVEMVLGIFFFTFSKANIHFADKEITGRPYTAAEAPFTIKRLELIDKKEFVKVVLDENIEVFMMHVTSLSLSLILIHPARKPQIALIIVKKVKISTKYLNFNNVFFEKKGFGIIGDDQIKPTRYQAL